MAAPRATATQAATQGRFQGDSDQLRSHPGAPEGFASSGNDQRQYHHAQPQAMQPGVPSGRRALLRRETKAPDADFKHPTNLKLVSFPLLRPSDLSANSLSAEPGAHGFGNVGAGHGGAASDQSQAQPGGDADVFVVGGHPGLAQASDQSQAQPGVGGPVGDFASATGGYLDGRGASDESQTMSMAEQGHANALGRGTNPQLASAYGTDAPGDGYGGAVAPTKGHNVVAGVGHGGGLNAEERVSGTYPPKDDAYGTSAGHGYAAGGPECRQNHYHWRADEPFGQTNTANTTGARDGNAPHRSGVGDKLAAGADKIIGGIEKVAGSATKNDALKQKGTQRAEGGMR
ncbi:hypothetical protein HMN09_01004800 [Mycena chlorophos]|uniref:Uncharacterized protein n=1 Tax=Mycena chlorophos TaxID=658473 RepID=A0A8H6SHZ9_MYCCL|nr:hypothetical protein HMN09_01004800 [Mycena chlorophos]